MIANRDANGNDLGNLIITTGSLTFSDLKNYNNSESNNFSSSLQVGINPNNPTLPGSLTLNSSMQGMDSSSDSKATIGLGTININNAAVSSNSIQLSNLNRDISNIEQNHKDVLTSDFNAELVIDLRLLAAAGNLIVGDSEAAKANTQEYWSGVVNGWNESKRDLRLGGEVLKVTREFAEDNFGILGTALTQPTSAAEGAVYTFLEDGSYAYKKTDDLSKIFGIKESKYNLSFELSSFEPQSTENNNHNIFANQQSTNSNLYFYQKVDDVSTTQGYALNGINTSFEIGFGNYLVKNGDVTFRHNPTHGAIGDLIECGIGKVMDWFGFENAVVMNRIATQDLRDRRDVINAVNLYHSQGTIIGKSAMELYAKTFQEGVDLEGNSISGNYQINQTQRFVAVGPAVLEADWINSATMLGKQIGRNSNWEHDPYDSVRYLAAPSNLVNDVGYVVTLGNKIDSPVYLPNPISTITAVALLPLIEHHDVKNPSYMQHLKNLDQEQKQDPILQKLNDALNINLNN